MFASVSFRKVALPFSKKLMLGQDLCMSKQRVRWRLGRHEGVVAREAPVREQAIMNM
jgi:hypothetical protein